MPLMHAEFWSLGFFLTDTCICCCSILKLNKWINTLWILSTLLSKGVANIKRRAAKTSRTGGMSASSGGFPARAQKGAAFNYFPALCWDQKPNTRTWCMLLIAVLSKELRRWFSGQSARHVSVINLVQISTAHIKAGHGDDQPWF